MQWEPVPEFWDHNLKCTVLVFRAQWEDLVSYSSARFQSEKEGLLRQNKIISHEWLARYCVGIKLRYLERWRLPVVGRRNLEQAPGHSVKFWERFCERRAWQRQPQDDSMEKHEVSSQSSPEVIGFQPFSLSFYHTCKTKTRNADTNGDTGVGLSWGNYFKEKTLWSTTAALVNRRV